MKYTKILFSIVFTLLSVVVFGQSQLKRAPGTKPQAPKQQQQPKPQQQGDKVELQSADSLVGGVFNGQRIDKLIGNVKFKQRDAVLFADSVYQYKERNFLEAFGNVRINQADTVTMRSDRAIYDGNSRIAKMVGNVVMNDPRMTLTTPSMDYNLNEKTASYTEGGVIVDPENRLESRRGTYDTRSKMYTFQQDVKVATQDYKITAQNLRYNTLSKIVYFQGPTFIRGQQGDLYAEEGTYNTITKVSNFGRNAYILTKEYRLGGDKLYYNQNTGYGFAEKNVSLRSLKDDVTIRGQVGRYWRDRGEAKVYGSPVMESILDKDTLYLSADTLYSREASAGRTKSMLFAYPNVKIFKKDLQGKADSLSYNRTDSVMHFNRKPVLWSENSQLVSDTIHVQLRNKTIDRMYMYSNAFIASEDSIKNYNQVKGRNMVAYFQEGNIRRVNVNGNGESLYFALEGDTALTGMNKAICSNMVLKFAENKLKTISFLVQPDASFIPPHELPESERQLEGFTWMADLRPTKKDVFAVRVPEKKKVTTPVKKAPASKPSKKGANKPAVKTEPLKKNK
ncbi:lipopolysaccharide export system protein LptA [Pontibacter aydingkolensis]|uniref:LPS export ABC transporter periplasmic protein LptC n=1 Tax=Pontibacter aydingkolensis TaxID=1911536 RepID=A0ABS7CRC9_9BACT|nr:OstA-like protein [Pontibacter aydingkolensis]MBW7466406.1 LPS export ABC transporter periplasmic protein LptC [Pontibacter aydingkolensis]